MKKYKHVVWISLVIIILAPILVNWLMMCHSPIESFKAIGDYNVWIPFWGSLIGALIAGVITIYLLHETLKANAKTSKEALAASEINSEKALKANRTAIYISHKKEELNRFINEMVKNYTALNLVLIFKAREKLALREYSNAGEIFKNIMCDFDSQVATFRISFERKNMSSSEESYCEFFGKLYSNVMFLISDLESISTLSELISNFSKKINEEDIMKINRCIALLRKKYDLENKNSTDFQQYIKDQNDYALKFIHNLEAIPDIHGMPMFEEKLRLAYVYTGDLIQQYLFKKVELQDISLYLIEEKEQDIEDLLKGNTGDRASDAG